MRLPAPREGVWTLLASAPGTATGAVSLEAGEPSTALQLPPAGALRATVPGLEPATGILISIEDAGGGRLVQVGAGGSTTDTFSGVAAGVAIAGLPPGPVRVVAVAGDGRRFAGDAGVDASATRSIELVPGASP